MTDIEGMRAAVVFGAMAIGFALFAGMIALSPLDEWQGVTTFIEAAAACVFAAMAGYLFAKVPR